MTNGNKLVLATAFLLVPLWATDVGLAAPGKSHKGGSGKGNVKTRFDADRQPPSPPPLDPTTAPEGDAEYAQKINKNVDRQGFKARVEVPGIIDEAAAQGATVDIRLSRGTQYASCLFEFESFEDGRAEYKVDVRYHSQPAGSVVHPRFQFNLNDRVSRISTSALLTGPLT